MSKLRVVHYLNQFFAGLGGEERAGEGPGVKEGAVGPGQVVARLLGEEGVLAATVYCGDNHVSERGHAAVEEILEYVGKYRPGLVLAGPAFNAGRYGLACGQVGAAVQKRLGVPAVVGMHPDNPAVEMYRSELHIVQTGASAATMAAALQRMVALGLKLARGEPLGPPQEEGYVPRGLRRMERAPRLGAVRAVDMMLKRLRGEQFQTELPGHLYDRVPAAAPIKELSRATIALVTSGGVVPKGNPDRIESTAATKWLKYRTAGLNDLTGHEWESIHGGYNTTYAREDPDRVLPLDVMRDLEAGGAIGRLFDYFYTTVGSHASVGTARRFGRQIAEDLAAAKVDGVILTATGGTCTRCGATMAKELDRAGIPTAFITTIVSLAQNAGANRIITGKGVTNPLGDPRLPQDEERALRRRLVRRALEALQSEAQEQLILE